MFPTQLKAGFDNAWEIADTDYPVSDGWALKYTLRPANAVPIEIDAEPLEAEAAFSFVLSSRSTAPLPGGIASWQCAAERLSERKLVASGRVEILPDFSNKAVDPRSYPEIMIAACDAALAGKLDDPVTEQEYDGRKVKFMSTSEIIRVRGYFLELLPDNKVTHEYIRFSNVQ